MLVEDGCIHPFYSLIIILLFVFFPPKVGHLCPPLDWAWLPACLEASLRSALGVGLVFPRLSGSSVIATERQQEHPASLLVHRK